MLTLIKKAQQTHPQNPTGPTAKYKPRLPQAAFRDALRALRAGTLEVPSARERTE